MKVYINDGSIEGQAETEVEALTLLKKLATAITASSCLAQAGKAYRTRELPHRVIMPNVTVHNLIARYLKSKQYADVTQFILATVLTRPVDTLYHDAPEHMVTSQEGQCLKRTCFDSAVQSPSGALVISAVKSKASDYQHFIVSSSLFGQKKIANECEAEAISTQAWRFEHNPKHQKVPSTNKGNIASLMDLSEAQAQEVLSNGVMVGNRVFGHLNQVWYQFHRHEQGLYHGFRIELQANNPEHMTARKVFETLGYERCGQVYYE